MRRVPIRMKLAAALAVPMLGLFLVTTVELVEITREAARIRSQTQLARSTLGPSGLITTLQNERTWAVVELIGLEDAIQPPVREYDETRQQTNQAIAAFRDTISHESGAVRDAYGPALANLATLEQLRSSIDASAQPHTMANISFADEVYRGYADAIMPFLDASGHVTLAVDDAELRKVSSLVNVTTRQVETISDLARTAILAVVVGGGLDERDEIAATARVRSAFDRANEELRGAGPPYDDLVRRLYPADMVDGFTAQIDAAIAGRDVDTAALVAPLNVPPDGGYTGLRADLVDALNVRADELNARAGTRQRLYLAVASVALALTGLLTWTVSRSITKPLRSLTRQAKAMADSRLPDAVMSILDTPLGEDIVVPRVRAAHVRTRDEVSDVADALNTVQDTALDLAVEQAVLRRNIADSFVNLGRRNQNLLGRQLDFITELESNETDADALANLFRLDHLATRMRRNAESLLVLAGIEPPRQWAAPVRLTDVIRAALGEVEDYQRVTVRGVEPATILGSAAADLAHLLAELIENALVFSPPDQSVDIRGRNRPDGYTLAIIDSGLGMPAADVAAANRRLAGAESFTIAPSKYLGHYVAGNLAARHDIKVRLDNSPGTGITATIDIPPTLLTTDHELAAPITPPHGSRAISPAASRPVAADPLAALSGPAPAGAPAINPFVTGESPAAPGPAGPAPVGPAPFGPVPTGPVPVGPVAGMPPAPAASPWAAVADVPGFDPARRADAPPAPPPPPLPARNAGQLGGPVPQPPPGLGAGPSSSEPTADSPPTRTASGLVKRARRGTGQTTAGAVPDDALLASLSNVTSNLGQRPQPPAPPEPRASEPIGPTWPRPAARPGAEPTVPTNRSWPAPPVQRSDGPAFGSPPPAAGRGGNGLSPLPSRGGPGMPGVPGPGPTSGGATASGLARRVRGAQLPVTQPLNVRRHQERASGSQERPSGGDAGYGLGDRDSANGQLLGNGNTNGRPNGQSNHHASGQVNGRDGTGDHHESSAARSVYGFLTSFTQGVQRGLEEARRDPNTLKENP